MAKSKKRKHGGNAPNRVKKELSQQTVSNSKPNDGPKMIIRIAMLILALVLALSAILPLLL